jgi:hypothetical protein
MVPDFVVSLAYGSEFDDAAQLLWLFAVAMSGYAVLNILLFYHLGRNSSSMSWLLLAGAGAEAIGFAIYHDSARELLFVSIGTAVVLLAVHELTIQRSLAYAGAAGFRAGKAWFTR